MFVCVCHHGRGKSCDGYDLRRGCTRVRLAKSLSPCQAVEGVRRSGPSQASCLDNTPLVLICVRQVTRQPGAFQSPIRGKIFNFFTRFPSLYKWEGRVLIRDMFYLIADCDGAEAAQKHWFSLRDETVGWNSATRSGRSPVFSAHARNDPRRPGCDVTYMCT